MEMQKVYICYTIYHLLITIIKSENQKEQIEIVLMDSIKDRNRLKTQLESKNYRVVIYHNWQNVEKSFLINEIYIFNDCTSLGQLLHKKRITYNLIEDGYGSLVYTKERVLFKKIVNFFRNLPQPGGFSKYCVSIEVTDKGAMEKDSRYNKIIEVRREELFNTVSEKIKQDLFDIFQVTPLNIDRYSAIIITQPLAADKWYKTRVTRFQSEKEQIEFYKNIINRLKNENYTVYMKVHPRDTCDYSMFDANILEKNIPIELIGMLINRNFKIGITHSSTSIDFIDFIDEKVKIFEL
ncbi:glycosyltransferase family 52 [Streptococcus sp. 20-1249]|uniref:glycosyltransferase family 52 n=1 Tax=Streptococcus hepaticus TaxID=3349163 RepID=UPI00374A3A37